MATKLIFNIHANTLDRPAKRQPDRANYVDPQNMTARRFKIMERQGRKRAKRDRVQARRFVKGMMATPGTPKQAINTMANRLLAAANAASKAGWAYGQSMADATPPNVITMKEAKKRFPQLAGHFDKIVTPKTIDDVDPTVPTTIF